MLQELIQGIGVDLGQSYIIFQVHIHMLYVNTDIKFSSQTLHQLSYILYVGGAS